MEYDTFLPLADGASEELLMAFSSVAGTTGGPEGELKYSRHTMQELARIVAVGNNSSLLRELVHLIHMAEICAVGREGYVGFFFADHPTRGSYLHATVANRLKTGGTRRSGLEISPQTATLTYPDGRFAIAWSRMPVLVAFFEFLVQTLGFAIVDDAIRDLFKDTLSDARVKETTNRLSRELYGYLSDHLPPMQLRRKFRAIGKFLAERNREDGAVDGREEGERSDGVDNAAILAFWLRESGPEAQSGLEFRLYKTVVQDMLAFARSMEASRDRLEMYRARPLGTEREAGEVDPDAEEIEARMSDMTPWKSPLTILQAEPANQVKALNQREQESLETLVANSDRARLLKRTLMRYDVFTPWQSTLSLHQGKPKRQPLTDSLRAGPGADYAGRHAELEKIRGHLTVVLKAVLHVLVRARRREALSLIVALCPQADLSRFNEHFRAYWASGDPPEEEGPPDADNVVSEGVVSQGVVSLGSPGVHERFLDLLEDNATAGPELAALMREARRAFRSVSRRGFGRADIENPDIIEGHVAAAPALLALIELLEPFLGTRDPEADWDPAFEKDRTVFTSQFTLLYGDKP